MNQALKLYTNALYRFKRSKGFGIHSPFAYSFVVDVLREKLAYYAYDTIREHRESARILASEKGSKVRIISLKNALMLFRIAQYFNPRCFLQVGTSYGVSTTALLAVDSKSSLMIYPGKDAHKDIYGQITKEYTDRITEFKELKEMTDAYTKAISDEKSRPFLLINAIDSESQVQQITDFVNSMLERDGVVIVRNLMKSDLIVRFFDNITGGLSHGMTFTNGRLAVIVGYRYLPKQKFSLWY